MRFKLKPNSDGFTLVEILTVVVILGILAGIIWVNLGGRASEDTRLNRAIAELGVMANATKLYAIQYNEYPADVNRAIPGDIFEFIDGGQFNSDWPGGPWDNSVYDYESWDDGDTIQISIRFCPSPSSPLEDCDFPDQPWASNFDAKSAIFYCIKEFEGGQCRSHSSEPATHPGYCITCAVKEIPNP